MLVLKSGEKYYIFEIYRVTPTIPTAEQVKLLPSYSWKVTYDIYHSICSLHCKSAPPITKHCHFVMILFTNFKLTKKFKTTSDNEECNKEGQKLPKSLLRAK